VNNVGFEIDGSDLICAPMSYVHLICSLCSIQAFVTLCVLFFVYYVKKGKVNGLRDYAPCFPHSCPLVLVLANNKTNLLT
jgi:hypothetical protein